MKFSIIVPLYLPYKEFIPECILSIKNQTFRDFECILVLPSSQLEEFKSLNVELDDRFRIIESEHTAQSANRNAGIECSNGDYITFVDCDDMLSSEFISFSNEVILRNNPDLIIYDFTRELKELNQAFDKKVLIFNNSSDIKNIIFSEFNCKQSITRLNINPVWNKVFKADIIKKNDILFDEKTTCAEDVLFVADYGHFVSNISICEDFKSYLWRKNSSSVMNKLGPFYDLNQFFIHFDKIAKIENFNEEYCKYKYKIFSLRVSSILSMYVNNKISSSEMISFFRNFYGHESYVVSDYQFLKLSRGRIHKYILNQNYFRLKLMLKYYKIRN